MHVALSLTFNSQWVLWRFTVSPTCRGHKCQAPRQGCPISLFLRNGRHDGGRACMHGLFARMPVFAAGKASWPERSEGSRFPFPILRRGESLAFPQSDQREAPEASLNLRPLPGLVFFPWPPAAYSPRPLKKAVILSGSTVVRVAVPLPTGSLRSRVGSSVLSRSKTGRAVVSAGRPLKVPM